MNYSDLNIQTQRSAPSEFRTPGASFLYRASYLQRDLSWLPLGQQTIEKIRALLNGSFSEKLEWLEDVGLLAVGSQTSGNYYLSHDDGDFDVLFCPECYFAERTTLVEARVALNPAEEMKPLEKIKTPDCSTINSLADFLKVSPTKTAKALMFTRVSDGKFLFVVLRGDRQLSDEKLTALVGEYRLATQDEILTAGAIPGYASPVGVTNAMIIVDSIVAKSKNLVAGANEGGYHLLNTNIDRDYSADIIADVTLMNVGEGCPSCSRPLSSNKAFQCSADHVVIPENILKFLAETASDERGLKIPAPFSPFQVYLMNLPGSTMDTAQIARDLNDRLSAVGITVLLDVRDERAGIKFNDADLIGCPIRVTVGERGLQNQEVEVKPRAGTVNRMVKLTDLEAVLLAQLAAMLERSGTSL